VLFTLDFGADRHLIAFDRNLDIFLRRTRDLGLHDVDVVLFGDVHLDRRGARLFEAHGTEETAEQLVDSGIGERVVRSQLVHRISLYLHLVNGTRVPLCLRLTRRPCSPICGRVGGFQVPDTAPISEARGLALPADDGGIMGANPPPYPAPPTMSAAELSD